MDQMFQFGTEDFISYQKDRGDRPTKHQRKIAKLQKLHADLKDPQKKRKRNQISRKQAKQKQKKQIQGMTEEQIRQFLNKKIQKKKQIKQKCMKALQTGMQIFIDIAYEEKMNSKEIRSLVRQIQLITQLIKHQDNPPGIHLCGVNGDVKAKLQKMNYKYWTLTSSQDDVLQVAQKMGKRLVYLSPDSPNTLQKIQEDVAYVIGGLVDRTVIKNASLSRASYLSIPAVRLPINQFMKQRKCLNLDHVVKIMSKYKDCNNWKQAFEFAVPKRWKRQQQKEESSQQQLQKKQQQIQILDKKAQNEN